MELVYVLFSTGYLNNINANNAHQIAYNAQITNYVKIVQKTIGLMN